MKNLSAFLRQFRDRRRDPSLELRPCRVVERHFFFACVAKLGRRERTAQAATPRGLRVPWSAPSCRQNKPPAVTHPAIQQIARSLIMVASRCNPRFPFWVPEQLSVHSQVFHFLISSRLIAFSRSRVCIKLDTLANKSSRARI